MSRHHRANGTAYALAKARPSIRAGLPSPCVNACQYTGIVYPGEAFDVGHIVGAEAGGTNDRSNLGPAHVKCNRSDGGKVGAARTNAARRSQNKRRPW
jgi:hypothetical protein